jgi:hypothetical protein
MASKSQKAKVYEIWRKEFGFLLEFSRGKMYRLTDFLLIGIELINLPKTGRYRPHFVIYPLWKEKVETCLDTPLLYNEYKNHTGEQINLTFSSDEPCLYEVINVIKEKSPWLVTQNDSVVLEDVITLLDLYCNQPPLRASKNSFLQAIIKEAKIELAVLSDDELLFSQVSDEIQITNWDKEHFKMCGEDVEQWRQKVFDTPKLSERLKNNVLQNKMDKRFL